MTKGIVVAGTASSAGKTTVTLGLMAALKGRGVRIQPFKVGPDYIDPGHHSALLGISSYNLDTWMCGAAGVKSLYRRLSAKADLSIIEGVMGLFDGRFTGGKAQVSAEGSTAHLAKVLKKPVLLVVDAKSAAMSAGAIVKGFNDFDPDLSVKYVIFNRVGSDRHAEILKDSIKGIKGVTLLGCVRRDEKLKMPARHLGLVTNADIERKRWKSFVRAARKAVEEGVDVDRLLRLLKVKPVKVRPKESGNIKAARGEREKKPALGNLKGVCIAVARDSAFCFYYQENLNSLVKAGAHLLYFSPIKTKTLPRGVDGIYLGGGYPELHAKELEANVSLRSGIMAAAESGMPIFAECGGLVYLCKSIKQAAGSSVKGEAKGCGVKGLAEMVGLFPFKVEMTKRRVALGYREVTATGSFPFLPEGESVRGHEYHYSRLYGPQKRAERAFIVEGAGEKGDGKGFDGYVYKQVAASYTHVHFTSNPAFAPGFVSACASYKRLRVASDG